MYLFPPIEARAAVAVEENVKRAATTNDIVDPFESLISVIFGPDDPETTTTKRTSTTARTSSTPLVLTPTTPTTTSTRTSTTTSSTHTTAQVVTSPPPNVITTPRSTMTVTASAATNTSNSAAAQTPTSKSGLPSVVIGVIVAASVIFGLIFLSLLTRKILQARRRNRRKTWMDNGAITPFAPGITSSREKALPPPPPAETEYPSYPAYPPAALTYANNPPYSPAAPSSAGYPAPPSAMGAGTGNALMMQTNPNTLLNVTPADLAGPVVIQQTPPTPLTATATAGQISVVKRTFVPSLPDELSISNGDQVRVLSSYDDGWALCEKVSTGEKGVVPQECLEEIRSSATSNIPGNQGEGRQTPRLNRGPSLRRDQNTY